MRIALTPGLWTSISIKQPKIPTMNLRLSVTAATTELDHIKACVRAAITKQPEVDTDDVLDSIGLWRERPGLCNAQRISTSSRENQFNIGSVAER